jgi:hypothetical protein
MLARFSARLTYANVVATLALFIALGGTGYAASQLTGRDIKNRSLTGADIKKNAIGGNEVNESKLRTVPRALNATNAASADVSKNAGNAVRSQTAGTADLAAIATNASALAGQGAAAFEKSTRVTFGRAPVAPAGESSEQVVLSWPEMGVELTSSSVACSGGDLRFAVRNTKASGPAVQIVEAQDSVVAPGTRVTQCGGDNEFEGELTDSTGRTLYVDCTGVQGELRCLGVRSEP